MDYFRNHSQSVKSPLIRYKWIGVIAAVCFVHVASAQPSSLSKELLRSAFNWFGISEMCQKSAIVLTKENIHRGMTLDIANISKLPYPEAETLSDNALAEYERVTAQIPPSVLKKAHDIDDGSLNHMHSCTAKGFEAQQQFRRVLRKTQQ